MTGRPRATTLRPATLALCSLALTACASAGPTFRSDWALDPVWDDGLAEVATYEASRPIYGADRPYVAVLLTVKEDLDARTAIKADPPLEGRELVTVLKQNTVREIPTPNYDYRMMTSVFVRRDEPARAVKLTSTSHEWCGNTWQRARVRGDRVRHEWSSYFEGEGDGEATFALGDALFVDQLPLVLRGLPFAAGHETSLELVVPTFARSHAGPLERRPARLHVNGRETLETPGGRREAWRVTIAGDGIGIRLWFAVDGTRPLLRLETDDGERLALRSIERRAYWRLP